MRERERERERVLLRPTLHIDPVKLIGLVTRNDFNEFGLCQIVIRSTDTELVSNIVMFGMECGM